MMRKSMIWLGCSMFAACSAGSSEPASELQVNNTLFPAAQVGQPYANQLAASGGTSPYQFGIGTGSLPPGVTLSGDTISGIPQIEGDYSFTVTVTDSSLQPETAERPFAIRLRQQTRQRHDLVPLPPEGESELGGTLPRSGEDQSFLWVFTSEDLDRQLGDVSSL